MASISLAPVQRGSNSFFPSRRVETPQALEFQREAPETEMRPRRSEWWPGAGPPDRARLSSAFSHEPRTRPCGSCPGRNRPKTGSSWRLGQTGVQTRQYRWPPPADQRLGSRLGCGKSCMPIARLEAPCRDADPWYCAVARAAPRHNATRERASNRSRVARL